MKTTLWIFATLVSAWSLQGCSLFGPPLPPAVPREDVAEHMAEPDRKRQALIDCAAQYGSANGAAANSPPETIADAAMYACRSHLEAYEQLIAERSKYRAEILGFISTAKKYTRETVDAAKKDAHMAAVDAAIRARTAH